MCRGKLRARKQYISHRTAQYFLATCHALVEIRDAQRAPHRRWGNRLNLRTFEAAFGVM